MTNRYVFLKTSTQLFYTNPEPEWIWDTVSALESTPKTNIRTYRGKDFGPLQEIRGVQQ